jgi:acetylornithine aminotransferase
MLDEVQTGVARTGRWWAHQHEGVSPDVMTLAKGLGGGLPIGACLAGPAAAGVLGPGDHASTFGGGPVQCAAALTVLDVIEDGGLVEHGSHLGKLALEQLADGLDGCDVRGRGLLIGVELPRDRAAEVVEGCARRGVLVNNATPNVLRIAPPLVIEGDELSEALEVVVEVCGEVAAA